MESVRMGCTYPSPGLLGDTLTYKHHPVRVRELYEKVVCERLPLERFLYERSPFDKVTLTRSVTRGTGSDSSRCTSHGDHCLTP